MSSEGSWLFLLTKPSMFGKLEVHALEVKKISLYKFHKSSKKNEENGDGHHFDLLIISCSFECFISCEKYVQIPERKQSSSCLTPKCLGDHIWSPENFGSFVCGQLKSFDNINFFRGRYTKVTFG